VLYVASVTEITLIANEPPTRLDCVLFHFNASKLDCLPAGARSFRRKNHRLEAIFLLIAQFSFEVLQRNLN
jgi:hypothetical protein